MEKRELTQGTCFGDSVRGWVYVLANRAMPWLVKVGRTKDDPDVRAAQLSGRTAVPLAFQVSYKRPVMDCVEAEQAAQLRLARYRLTPCREFFVVTVDEAIREVDAACSTVDIIRGVV